MLDMGALDESEGSERIVADSSQEEGRIIEHFRRKF
jgi:hypothetical protein